MPTRTDLRNMSKAQLVDFGCGFFEDTGHLRQELNEMSKPDLLDLLIENGADEVEEVTPAPEVTVKAQKPPSPLDLGSG